MENPTIFLVGWNGENPQDFPAPPPIWQHSRTTATFSEEVKPAFCLSENYFNRRSEYLDFCGIEEEKQQSFPPTFSRRFSPALPPIFPRVSLKKNPFIIKFLANC